MGGVHSVALPVRLSASARAPRASLLPRTTQRCVPGLPVRRTPNHNHIRVVSAAAASENGGEVGENAAEAQAWIDKWSSKNANQPDLECTGEYVNPRWESVEQVLSYSHKVLAVGLLFAGDFILQQVFASYSIVFPSALGGMFMIIAGLLAAEAVAPKFVDFAFLLMRPGLDWVARWMPLFYVPTLITLPLSLNGMDPVVIYKIMGVVALGWPASLAFTAACAVTIRKVFGGQAPEATKEKESSDQYSGSVFVSPPPPASPQTVLAVWGAVWVAALLIAELGISPETALVGVPYMLASVVGSFLIGLSFPEKLKKVLHPLVTCFILTDVAIIGRGLVYGVDWATSLGSFLTRGAGGTLGAGDLLMKFLGCVILSFGFRIYEQRALVKRHFVEIVGTMTLSAMFSLVVTLLAASALGLSSELSRAIAPRCITVALALPVGQQLGAGALAPITAVAVVLTGLLGANFAQSLLTKLGFNDPITRGMATAGSSHGLGTAALAATEKSAVPFAALAYAFMGIISNVMVSIPAVRMFLIGLVGV